MKFNAFQLKYIAAALMLCDHVAVFARPVLADEVYYALRYAGRFVLPIFLFVLIESFFRTSNQRRFVQRLWIWALSMMIGSYALMKFWDGVLARADQRYVEGFAEIDRFIYGVGNNIFLAFACVVTILYGVQHIREYTVVQKMGAVALILVLIGACYFVEGGYLTLGIAFAFFVGYRNSRIRYASFIAVIIAYTAAHLQRGELWYAEDGYNWMMLGAIPFIALYSGQRGQTSMLAKYSFYVWYILHLWAVYSLARVLGWR